MELGCAQWGQCLLSSTGYNHDGFFFIIQLQTNGTATTISMKNNAQTN